MNAWEVGGGDFSLCCFLYFGNFEPYEYNLIKGFFSITVNWPAAGGAPPPPDPLLSSTAYSHLL